MISNIMKSIVALTLLATLSFSANSYDKAPPFTMDKLEKVKIKGKEAYQSKTDYSIPIK